MLHLLTILLIPPILASTNTNSKATYINPEFTHSGENLKVIRFVAYDRFYEIVLEPNRTLLKPALKVHVLEGEDWSDQAIVTVPYKAEKFQYIDLKQLFQSEKIPFSEEALYRLIGNGRLRKLFQEVTGFVRLSSDCNNGVCIVNGVIQDSATGETFSFSTETLSNSKTAVKVTQIKEEELLEKIECLQLKASDGTRISPRRAPSPKFPILQPASILDKPSPSIPQNAMCPTRKKTMQIGIFADCNYTSSFSSTMEAKNEIINNVSIASSVLEKHLNVAIRLDSLYIVTSCSTGSSTTPFNQVCRPDYSINDRLNSFSKWRGGRKDNVAILQLLTNCYKSGTVGIAWPGTICKKDAVSTTDNRYIAGTSVASLHTKNSAVQIMVHELLHNMGASHDCDETGCLSTPPVDCCPCDNGCDCKGKYVMNSYTNFTPVITLSPCTIREVCNTLPIYGSCLYENSDTRGLQPTCGNGIKEDGEDCDCGDAESCALDPCCNPDCTFKAGAKCSDKNDPCCDQCQLIPASAKVVCEPGRGPCQVDSICDGKSASCPNLIRQLNGISCSNSSCNSLDVYQPSCVNGVCTSRDLQCRAIGTRTGITKACSDYSSTCQVYCELNFSCVKYDLFFMDGTPCSGSGICQEGKCVGGSILYLIKDYWLIFAYCLLIFVIFVYILISGLSNLRKQRQQKSQTSIQGTAVAGTEPATATE